MSDAEVITILIMFHMSGYRYFKHFYKQEILERKKFLFPGAVSYKCGTAIHVYITNWESLKRKQKPNK